MKVVFSMVLNHRHPKHLVIKNGTETEDAIPETRNGVVELAAILTYAAHGPFSE